MIFIGSSSQSTYGVGALLKWNKEELASIKHDDYGWVIIDLAGTIFLCYAVMSVEGPGLEVKELYPEEFDFATC